LVAVEIVAAVDAVDERADRVAIAVGPDLEGQIADARIAAVEKKVRP